jgi:hypothetical protein
MSFDTHEAQHFFTLMWYLFNTHTALFSFFLFIVIIVFNDESLLQREFECEVRHKKGVHEITTCTPVGFSVGSVGFSVGFAGFSVDYEVSTASL